MSVKVQLLPFRILQIILVLIENKYDLMCAPYNEKSRTDPKEYRVSAVHSPSRLDSDSIFDPKGVSSEKCPLGPKICEPSARMTVFQLQAE